MTGTDFLICYTSLQIYSEMDNFFLRYYLRVYFPQFLQLLILTRAFSGLVNLSQGMVPQMIRHLSLNKFWHAWTFPTLHSLTANPLIPPVFTFLCSLLLCSSPLPITLSPIAEILHLYSTAVWLTQPILLHRNLEEETPSFPPAPFRLSPVWRIIKIHLQCC